MTHTQTTRTTTQERPMQYTKLSCRIERQQIPQNLIVIVELTIHQHEKEGWGFEREFADS